MPSCHTSSPRGNHILARLPQEEYQRLLPHLKCVDMKVGQVLYKAGQDRPFAFFPLNCVVAFLYQTEEGKTTKVGMTGRDGFVGMTQFLGSYSNLTQWIVQSSGTALRIPTDELLREIYNGGQLMSEVLRWIQYYLMQVSQLSICHRHHHLEQQLCSWLLSTLDRTDSNSITATQDLLSTLLGARRQGLSEASTRLERLGLIERRRGVISVPKPQLLKPYACECYGVLKSERMRLFPLDTQPDASSQDRKSGSKANGSTLQSSYLSQRVAALEMALNSSGLAWWDVNLLTGLNEVLGCEQWTGMLGYAPGEFHPNVQQWDARVHPNDRATRDAALLAHLSGAKPRYECEYRIAHKQGHWVWIAARGMVALRDENGQPLRLVGTNQDITRRKEDDSALQLLVRTDFLTGTATRRYFFEVAEREFERAKRHNSPLSMLAIDLDHFKKINDTYGHEAGDQVLKSFAHTVKSFLRVSDVFGRTGGEEFCLLMPHTDDHGALFLAQRVIDAVLAQPLQTGSLSIAYTVSLGVCTLKPDMPDFASLMRCADNALYSAKALGRNRLAVAGG